VCVCAFVGVCVCVCAFVGVCVCVCNSLNYRMHGATIKIILVLFIL